MSSSEEKYYIYKFIWPIHSLNLMNIFLKTLTNTLAQTN